jgi:predicted phosphodiesterase
MLKGKTNILLLGTFVSIILNCFIPQTVIADGTFDNPVRFAIIGDRTSAHEPGIYGQIVTEIERLKPEFVITCGDMMEEQSDDERINAEWNHYLTLIEQLSMPIYYTPGNNDIYNELSEELYLKNVGKTYYSFDFRGIHFIILDNSRWLKYEDMPSEQLEWLIDDLQKNQDAAYSMAFYHIPIWYNNVADNKPDTLHSLYVKYGVDAVFTGHFHEYFSYEYDGVKYTNIGSSGGGATISPTGLKYHFLWVTLDKDGLHIAPIKINSVLAWDEITVPDRKKYRKLRQNGLVFENPLTVNIDPAHQSDTVDLKIDNSLTQFTIEDTLYWDIPEGWNVEPAAMEVNAAPGSETHFIFTANCKGKLYPLPKVSTMFTYAEGKRIRVESDLRIARYAKCFPRESKIKLDGKISEPFWNEPESELYYPEGSDVVIDPARFYFAYDKENLYIAAYCEDKQIDSLVANVIEPDGAVYSEDCIGFFFEPIIESDTVYQIYFNTLGTAFDQKITRAEGGYMEYDRNWNGKYETKVFRGEDFWSIEVKIPADQFSTKINADDIWRLNFRRKQKIYNSAADWMVPIGADPKRMGLLRMQLK